jgi:hypothetical protein
VTGTWREGSLAGDPEGYVKKALEMGISFHRGSIWGNLEEGLSTRDFERWMKGVLGVERLSLSLKRLRGGGLGGRGASSLGTLEDMLRKSPDAGISLHGGPFPPEENNLVCGGGSYTGDFYM